MLHVCCAPDATVPWPALVREGYETAGYFFGSNVHPWEEFLKRRDAVRSVAAWIGARLFEVPYAPLSWLEGITTRCRNCDLNGREGGPRCALCFRIQLEAAARCARDLGYDCLCSTLTISPHKNPGPVNGIGEAVSQRYGLEWLARIWRLKGGFRLSVQRSRKLGLYRQNYCGCVFSIRGE